jgi:hypothetical protein
MMLGLVPLPNPHACATCLYLDVVSDYTHLAAELMLGLTPLTWLDLAIDTIFPVLTIQLSCTLQHNTRVRDT